MMVEHYGSKFEVPDLLIDKYLRDFDSLPGSGYREGICQIRESIDEVLEIVEEEPDILEEPEYLLDFIRALAMKQALGKLGILYDS
jgi:hypothetical protein